MMGPRQPNGFTIIEILIFLAISGVLFASAMIMLSGKTDKTEFSTGIAQLRSELQSAVGNVGSGYYNLPPTYSCKKSATGPVVSSVAVVGQGVGQNSGCTFIGEVLQFSNATSSSMYTIYPVFGLRLISLGGGLSGGDVYSLATAHPQTERHVRDNLATPTTLPYGISVSSPGSSPRAGIYYTDSGGVQRHIGAIGIITTFNGEAVGPPGGFASVTKFTSGSQNVHLIPIPSSGLTDPPATTIKEISKITDDQTLCGGSGLVCLGSTVYTAPVNPASGISICFNSGTTQESGLITIGGSNSPTSITLTYFSKAGCV